MPNSNYLRGRRWEYAVKKDLESLGYAVMRTAGSHGPFDLIALKAEQPPLCVQCKVVDNHTDARRLLEIWRTPLPRNTNFHQWLRIKVTGSRESYSSTLL